MQVGSCVLKLVTFGEGSELHFRARRYLEKYDGLTKLPWPGAMNRELAEEEAFAHWAGEPLHIAVVRIVESGGAAIKAPTATLFHALRRASFAASIIEGQLYRIYPITAARAGLLTFWVSIPGLSRDEAQRILTDISQHKDLYMPEGYRLNVTLLTAEPETPLHTLLERP